MTRRVDNLIIGQGLAGSALAWTLHWKGETVQIVDRGEPNTASRVAAGLVTPLTGKRLVKSIDFEKDWVAALAFYRRVERETKTPFFTEQPMIRLFESEKHRTEYQKRSDQMLSIETLNWAGELQTGGGRHSGITMSPAGRLVVKRYLEATTTHFHGIDGHLVGEVDWSNDLRIEDTGVVLTTQANGEIRADRLFVCLGVEQVALFPGIPNNPSRGDILTTEIPGFERSEVFHRSVWIAPNTDGTQTVGATYDWKNTSAVPTQQGRTEVLSKLRRMVEGRVTVLEHKAGVRPTMKDYGPVIGEHPKHGDVFILNGLGSRGTLRAPRLAADLVSAIHGENQIDWSKSYQRILNARGAEQRRPLTALAQDRVAEVIQAGDTVIDATVGNGFDTCFLSEKVGEAGRVMGFDVQETALAATGQRLAAKGQTNVTLLHEGHQHLAERTEGGTIAAIMFNLGYLPRHDHTVITQPETSTQAIAAGIEALKSGGVMTVLCYRGHDGGEEEFAAVDGLLFHESSAYDLQRIDSFPAKESSPVLFVVRKR